MLPFKMRVTLGLIAILLLTIFIIGLAHSISSGFAGFWGGLPFWVIAILVLAMAWYDYYDTCVRRSENSKSK
jgi:membrane protein implicated in regulation of membrane protease activity